jgi:hypothetical protein
MSVAQRHLRSLTAILTSHALRGELSLPMRLYTVTDILIATRWDLIQTGLARQPSLVASRTPMTRTSLPTLQVVLRPSCRLPTTTSQVVQALAAPRLQVAGSLTVTPPMVAPQVAVPPPAALATP